MRNRPPPPVRTGRKRIEFRWPSSQTEAIKRLRAKALIVGVNRPQLLSDALKAYGVSPEFLAKRLWEIISGPLGPREEMERWSRVIDLASGDALKLLQRLIDRVSPAFRRGRYPVFGDMPLSHLIQGRRVEVATPDNLLALRESLKWLSIRRDRLRQNRTTPDSILRDRVLDAIPRALHFPSFLSQGEPQPISDQLIAAIFNAFLGNASDGGISPQTVASRRFHTRRSA